MVNLLQNIVTQEKDKLEENCADLRAKLADVRHKRAQLAQLKASTQPWSSTLFLPNGCRLDNALLEYKSALSAKHHNEKLLELSQHWNALQDCFYISHHGPFGTINGFRLGATAEPQPKIPWNEINAALGQLALLLLIMEQRCGIRYRNEIIQQGSTSRIKRRDYVYNLFSDDGFQFFGKRNFNNALDCLLECVVDAAEAIQQRDRTITLPYEMQVGKVGGVSIAYGQDGEWTRAMKYLLTNVKHLMTYRVFGFLPSTGV